MENLSLVLSILALLVASISLVHSYLSSKANYKLAHDKEKVAQTLEIANITRDVMDNSSFYSFINFYKDYVVKSNNISIVDLSKKELSFTKVEAEQFLKNNCEGDIKIEDIIKPIISKDNTKSLALLKAVGMYYENHFSNELKSVCEEKLFGLDTDDEINEYMKSLDSKIVSEISYLVDNIYMLEIRKVSTVLNRLECQCLMVKSDFVNIDDLYDLISDLFMNPMVVLYFHISYNNTSNVKPVYSNLRILYSEMFKIRQQLLIDEEENNSNKIKKCETKHKHI